MATTPNLNLPLNYDWANTTVASWAKSINDGNAASNAFQSIDDYAGTVNAALALRALQSDVYTKDETATLLTEYAPASGNTNIVNVGTLTVGTWRAAPIVDGYIASANTWNNKVGDVKVDGASVLDGVTANIDTTYTNSNPSTIDCGGIKKGTTFDKMPIKTLIQNMLYPYVAFNFTSVIGGGTYEYGTLVDVNSVTPYFTAGSTSLTSTKVGTTSGGNDLYNGTSCTSGSALALSSAKIYDGSTGGTIYMTLSDGTTTTIKSTAVTYTYYDYATLTSSTSAPTTGTKNSNDATYSYTSGQYLWILSHSISDGKLQTYVAGSWADVTTTASTVSFTLSSGATATYYAYRTDMFTATGSARYRLIAK